MKLKAACALLSLVCPLLASAEQTPQRGDYDPRVRVVDYNPAQVIKIATFYGVSTHIQFGDDETIRDVAVGDEQAWAVVPRGSHLFIKPKALNADTNVTVVSDQHTYHFALVVQPRPAKDASAWRDPNLVFSLSFRYPEREAAKEAAARAGDRAAAKRGEVSRKLAQRHGAATNTNYWVAGADEVSPMAARDDGRFIYLAFTGNRDLPAVFTVDAEGNEALVNTSVEGNEIVVQRMSAHLILRKGEWVACVVNRDFDANGGEDNLTGTTAPDVQRVIKEGK